jgi:hypothetical protein
MKELLPAGQHSRKARLWRSDNAKDRKCAKCLSDFGCYTIGWDGWHQRGVQKVRTTAREPTLNDYEYKSDYENKSAFFLLARTAFNKCNALQPFVYRTSIET